MNRYESERPTETPLESWKEIAAYLQRQAKTVRRWEMEEGLPVHRHSHKSRSSVYAYPSEIDAWRAGRRVVAETPALAGEAGQVAWLRPAWAGVTALLCLVMVGSGIRPASAAGQPPKPITRQVWAGRDVDDTGTVSADGRYLSFTDWSTGDLAVRDLIKGTNRRLTNTGGWQKSGDYADESAISADGSQIAYKWYVNKDSMFELRVMPVSGGKAWRVLDPGHDTAPVGWTPDGKQLLVVRDWSAPVSELGMIAVADGSYRGFKSTRHIVMPRLSPDGRWVAYGGLADEKTGQHDVYVLATDGSQETVVTPNPAEENPQAWSPDGSRLYFDSTRTGNIALWSVPIPSGREAGSPEIVRTDVGRIGSLGMTRKGVHYYNVPGSGGSNIYTSELAPGGTVAKPPVLASERFINSNGGASISPDGKFLAYFVFRAGFESVVAVRDLETGKERDLRPELLGFRDRPVWFPDGRSLLITTYDAPKSGMNLFRLDLASGEKELLINLPKRGGSFRLTPDGRSLFYVGEAPYEGSWATRLLRYDFDSRREADLTAGRLGIEEVAVSPDGKQLAYKALLKPGGVRVLAVMPSAGGTEKEIFRGPFLIKGNSLEWTPDGKYLLFGKAGENANAPGSLWRVSGAGGTPEPVGLSQLGTIRGPQVHPDGKRLFYTGSEPLREIWALENFIPNTTKGAAR